MESRYQQTQPLLLEKIIAALSYLTMGKVGFVWLLIGIFTKNNLRSYLKYHIFQSIFIAIAFFLISWFFEAIMWLLSRIPFLVKLVSTVTFYLYTPLLFGFSFLQILILGVIFYLIVTCLQGKYSYIPWVSDIIKVNVKNS